MMTDSAPAPARRVRWGLALAGAAFATAVLVAVGLGLRPGLGGAAPAFHGTAYPEPEAAPAFLLTDHHGRPAQLEQFRGQAVLLFFGFTHCPDVCPLTLARLREATEALGRRAGEVKILLITVDPERDTPEVLARYVESFGPRVVGLTGEPSVLAEVRRAYGVFAEAHPGHDGHPMLVHTTAVFGIDRAGRLRVLLRPDSPEDELGADLRALLAL